MVRVLHVIGKMDRAGAETMIMNIYRNIDRTKIQFDFMVFTDEKADYDEEIKELGGRIYHMPSFKGYNYLNLYRRFRKFFKEHPYKIVHGHIGSLAPAYLYCAKKEGLYTVAHSHCPNSNVFVTRIVFMILAYWVRYVADYYFACSLEAGMDRFGKKIVSSNRFRVINNAIESYKFTYTKERHQKMKEEYGLVGKTVLGHVGRFVPVKNHKFMIQLFEVIAKEDKNTVLVFIGEGEEKEAIEKMVVEKQLTDRVMFMGVREDIPDMMNLFDAFLFPSFYEGLGIVGIEAQAAGLPCFYSSVIPDEGMVTKNVWKLSLDAGVDVWKECILNVLKNYDRTNTVEEIKNSGFDIIQSAKELEEFYITNAKKCLVRG